MSKQTKRTSVSPRTESLNGLYAAVGVTLLSMVIGSGLPAKRLWGLGVWAEFGIPATMLAAMLTAGFALTAIWYTAKREQSHAQPTDARALMGFGLVTVVLAALFGLFHARTHFLGDGYTLISLLGADNPLIKTRSFGSGMLTVITKRILGGQGDAGALLAYQVVAVKCGLLFAIVSGWSAMKLYKDSARRWLWFGGLVTGGYALMFFGYAENYASFVVAVLACLVFGLLAIRQQKIPWLTIPLVGLAIFLHVLGTVLLPAVAYGILSQTPLGKRIESWSGRAKLLGIATILGAGTLLFAYAFTHDYYFRFSMLPLLSTMFVPDGYTLLSARHVVDYLNLLIILAPSIGILVVATKSTWRGLLTSYEGRFLGLALLGSLGATFIFDPKLGMPRDWDLFSFVGVPLLMLGLYAVLTRPGRIGLAAGVAAIILQMSFLVPRVAAIVIEEAGVRQFERYAALDVKRNRTGLYLLEKHYFKKRDLVMKRRIDSIRTVNFYEERLATTAVQLLKAQKLEEAKQTLDEMFRRNSAYSEYWLGLGRYLLAKKQADSALIVLQIADGLNPYSAIIQNEIGLAYYTTGNMPKAEGYFAKAAEIDTNMVMPLYNLAQIYLTRNELEKGTQFMRRAATRVKSDSDDLIGLADVLVVQKQYSEAAQWYKKALAAGVDTALIRERVTKNPELQEWLK